MADSTPSDDPAPNEARWSRPARCNCGKAGVATEAQARAGATLPASLEAAPFVVYRCPGTSVWHATTRGFHPRSLGTYGRLLAYFVLRHGEMSTRDALCHVWASGCRAEPDLETAARAKQFKSVNRAMQQLVMLGAAEWVDGDRPTERRVRPVDQARLRRVCEAGVEYTAEELGIEGVRTSAGTSARVSTRAGREG